MLEAGGQGGTYAPQPLLLALPDFWPPHYNSPPPQIFKPWDMPAFYSTQVFFTLLLGLAAFHQTFTYRLPTKYSAEIIQIWSFKNQKGCAQQNYIV